MQRSSEQVGAVQQAGQRAAPKDAVAAGVEAAGIAVPTLMLQPPQRRLKAQPLHAAADGRRMSFLASLAHRSQQGKQYCAQRAPRLTAVDIY